MPVDAEGNSADVVFGPDSTIARTNFGRPYVMEAGAVASKAHKVLMDMTGLDETADLDDVRGLSSDVFTKVWEFLIKLYDCINPKAADLFDKLELRDKKLHVQECLESKIIFIRDVACSRPWPHAIVLLDSMLPICRGPVTHQLIEDGKTETTKENFIISKYPVMLLDKTAEDTLTVATAAHGPFGVLIKHNQADKYSKPWKDSPARTIGESEGRAYTAHTKDPEMVAEMMDRANNPAVQLDMARKTVQSETPGNIPQAVDRQIHDFGNTQPLGIAANLLQCYGIRTVYVPEDLNPTERPGLK